MKTVLIISPYFPPVNAADMQRVRMSLPWFRKNGWEPVVFAVDPAVTEFPSDPLLIQSIPDDIEVYRVKALPASITRKIGLGAIALRSLPYYFLQVSRWIRGRKPDLIFFSTTQFPVLILAAYWRWRFKIKSVFDIQDPWVNTYYDSLPANQRPPKYWFSSRLNRLLEPIAMKSCNGLVAVSQAYIDDLKARYPGLQNIPAIEMPFPGSTTDIDIARTLQAVPGPVGQKVIRYVGRGGTDMHYAVRIFYAAIRKGLEQSPELFSTLHIQWYGTSYAPAGQGKPSLKPLADEFGLSEMVEEFTDRVPFFAGIRLLLDADFLVIPGSDDPRYSASKVYPYLLTGNPLIALFLETSNVVNVFKSVNPDALVTCKPSRPMEEMVAAAYHRLADLLSNSKTGRTALPSMNPYLAETMTNQLTGFFNRVITHE